MTTAQIAAIATALVNTNIVYAPEKTSVTEDGLRNFRILDVENYGIAKKTRAAYVVAKVQDLDCGGEIKMRTLHIAGIAR